MDYIYSRIDNNLVDINKIKDLVLKTCEEDNVPFDGLVKGNKYLELTVVDSDDIIYCSLADLQNDLQNAIDDLGSSNSVNVFTAIEPLDVIFSSIYSKKNSSGDIDPQHIDLQFTNTLDNGVWHYIKDLLDSDLAPEELAKVKIIILNGNENGKYLDDGNSGNRPIILSNFTTNGDNNSGLLCDFEFFGANGYTQDGGGWIARGAVKGIAGFILREMNDLTVLDITLGWSTIKFTSWQAPEAL